MVKWFWIPVALALGFVGAYLWAHYSAAAIIADLNTKYDATKAGLDSSTATVTDLRKQLADKDSKLSNALGQLQRADANAAGLAKSNNVLANQLAELKSVIAAGTSGLSDDEQTAHRLTGLLESSVELAGKL